MATTIFGAIKGHGAACLGRVHLALLRWTKPATGTLAGGAIVDVSRSKAALVAENVLLRQQLIVLRFAAGHPRRRHAASDRRLGRPATARGHALRHGESVSDP